ncbi:MAG: hypothetical protein M3O70_23565 [Actinomycetota bacterium]|nr:hypothetical protein [Actinomycetota bacterium]
MTESLPSEGRLVVLEAHLTAIRDEIAQLRQEAATSKDLARQYQQTQQALAAARHRQREVESALADAQRSLVESRHRIEGVEKALEREKVRYANLRYSRAFRLSRGLVRVAAWPKRALRTTYQAVVDILPPEQALRLRHAVASFRGRDPDPLGVDQRRALLTVPAPVETLADSPVVALMAWDVTAKELEGLLAEVTRLLEARRSFRPLFVTNCDAFYALRERGYLFEYVPPRTDWSEQFGSYDEFVNRRLQRILETYQPDRLLVVDNAQALDVLLPAVLDGFPGQAVMS